MTELGVFLKLSYLSNPSAVGFFFKVLKMKKQINKSPNDANMLLYAGRPERRPSAGSRSCARADWAGRHCHQRCKCMNRSGLDKTNEPHGLAKLGGVSGQTKLYNYGLFNEIKR